MIIFHRLWATMESRGISMYQLREKCGIVVVKLFCNTCG